MLKQRIKLTDPSTISLLLVNIIAIIFAVKEKWGIGMLLWLYWAQSLTIGVFTFLKIIYIKNPFIYEGKECKKIIPTNRWGQIAYAFFFALHYGGFHAVYFIFLLFQAQIDIDPYFLLSLAIFIMGSIIEFIRRPKEGLVLNEIMGIPYARIIPMHIAIILGIFLWPSIIGMIFFSSLKTVADVLTHMYVRPTVPRSIKKNKFL